MKQRFKDQYDDTLRAIELDDTYIKAYMVNGEALIELGKQEESTAKIEKGILRLRKALSMCMSQGQRQFEKEIDSQIRKANKIKWYKENELGHIDKTTLMSCLHSRLGDSSHDSNEILGRFAKYLNKSSNVTSGGSEAGT
jgi:hypothetical protein